MTASTKRFQSYWSDSLCTKPFKIAMAATTRVEQLLDGQMWSFGAVLGSWLDSDANLSTTSATELPATVAHAMALLPCQHRPDRMPLTNSG